MTTQLCPHQHQQDAYHEARGGGIEGGEGAVADQAIHRHGARQMTSHHPPNTLAVNNYLVWPACALRNS